MGFPDDDVRKRYATDSMFAADNNLNDAVRESCVGVR